ncbi:hypothetical protein L6Q96_11985 [Candidatus Binatia bacterium]|nr:hypothetical protein [Candidatus Binatia bacterium]
MSSHLRLCLLARVAAAAALTVLWIGAAHAQPGTLIKTIALPVTGFGVSVAADCTGNIFYTNASDSNLYTIDKDGNLLDTTPVTAAGSGTPLFMDEFAWDEGRKVLWAQEHNTNPINVYQLDPTTGVATFAFAGGSSIGSFRDGIGYDGTDDSLWISGDVSSVIDHYTTTGAFINQITPKNAGGGTLGFISGVVVGNGDLLYLGQNGLVQIVQVEKSDGDFLGVFASPGGTRDEGLECDPVNFAPNLALLSREAEGGGAIAVIELEPGTCSCGGGPPVQTSPVPAFSPVGMAVASLVVAVGGFLAAQRRRN